MQAKEVDVVHLEQPRIGRAMRRVARLRRLCCQSSGVGGAAMKKLTYDIVIPVTVQ